MLTYRQSTGEITDAAGKLLATGYSGASLGRNNPALQSIHNIGPLPRGIYDITGPECCRTFPCAQCGGAAEHHHGPFVLRLHPRPENEMFGRSGFLIHGTNATNTASQGCIILPRMIRVLLGPPNNDPVLEVIE